MLSNLLFDATSVSSYGFIADIVAVIIVVLFAIKGMKKGFIETLFGFIGTILALFLAFIFCGKFSQLIDGWFKLNEVFANLLQGAVPGLANPIGSGDIVSSLTGAGVPEFIANLVGEAIKNSALNIADGTTLAQLVAPMIVSIIAFIVLFILIKLVIFILKKILTSIFKLPILKQLNGLLGLVVGILEGLLIVCLILLGLNFIPSTAITEFIQSSYLIKYIYGDHNLLNLIFTKGFSLQAIKDYIVEILKANNLIQ